LFQPKTRRRLVAQWDATVRPQGGDRRIEDQVPSDAHLIPMFVAERETGIRRQLVSAAAAAAADRRDADSGNRLKAVCGLPKALDAG
jgi:hypothetical protein